MTVDRGIEGGASGETAQEALARLETEYREMASDAEAECEALEWAEALIGDSGGDGTP